MLRARVPDLVGIVRDKDVMRQIKIIKIKYLVLMAANLVDRRKLYNHLLSRARSASPYPQLIKILQNQKHIIFNMLLIFLKLLDLWVKPSAKRP